MQHGSFFLCPLLSALCPEDVFVEDVGIDDLFVVDGKMTGFCRPQEVSEAISDVREIPPRASSGGDGER